MPRMLKLLPLVLVLTTCGGGAPTSPTPAPGGTGATPVTDLSPFLGSTWEGTAEFVRVNSGPLTIPARLTFGANGDGSAFGLGYATFPHGPVEFRFLANGSASLNYCGGEGSWKAELRGSTLVFVNAELIACELRQGAWKFTRSGG